MRRKFSIQMGKKQLSESITSKWKRSRSLLSVIFLSSQAPLVADLTVLESGRLRWATNDK